MDRTPSVLFAAALVLGLGACGGSSNSPDPTPAPAAPLLADDTATALTGRDQLLDVLANDRDPAGGPLTLVSVSGQGQAVLALDGNRVRYRPRCCDLIADEFRYTARTAAGTTASAVVRLTLERRLLLRGTVADLGTRYEWRLFEGAHAGERRQASAPDFTLDLPLRTDATLLRVEARRLDAGGNASARDVLQSVLGDGAALAQAAGADGELGANEWEPLRVASLTTAWLGRLREANGGELPLDAARWTALQALPIDVEDVLTRAQLVKAALDDPAMVLPGSDTVALASSATQSAALLAAQPPDFVTRDRAPLFGLTSRRPFAAAPAVLWLYRGGLAQDEVASRLELGAGGSGRAIGPRGATPIAWSAANGVLSVSQSPPGSAPFSTLIFGSTVLRGNICTGGRPLDRVEDRVAVSRYDVRTLALGAGTGLPLPVVADYEGVALTGGSVSACTMIFSPLPLRAGIGLVASEQPRGATLPEGPMSGAWVLPRCQSCSTATPDARPLNAGRAFLDANRQGRGLFAEDAGVISAARVENGVVRLSYVGGDVLAYPVAGGEGAYRVVAAFPTPDGAGAVGEGWMVQEDASLRLAELWRGHTLRDCCRRADVAGLALSSDGSRFSGVELAAVTYSLEGRRVELELAVPGQNRPRIGFTALRRLADGRVLLLTRFDDDLEHDFSDEWQVDLVRFE